MKKPALLFLALAAVLSACGGGGGGGGGGNPVPSGPGPSSTPTVNPSPTATAAAGTTNASGVVVDDGTGNPLAGVSVKVMPWGPCGPTPAPSAITPESDGCPTPLPSPQATSAANGTFALNGIPNGHYVLIVGSDIVATPPAGYSPSTPQPNPTPCGNIGQQLCASPSPVPFTVQATVHDNVTFNGGNVTLVAPTLPPIPTYTPKPWETNGDYRIATLDAKTEMPCYVAWQYRRGLDALPLGTVDEWVTEQTRAINGAYQQGQGGGIKGLTTGGTQSSGGTACDASLIDTYAFTNNSYAMDLRTLWFGGQYLYADYNGNQTVSPVGLAEFPIDPRSFVDPNIPTWLSGTVYP